MRSLRARLLAALLAVAALGLLLLATITYLQRIRSTSSSSENGFVT